MLVTEGLTKQFQDRIVVNNLHLHIKKGEIYGFLGPNGAGKSTTIRLILGLTTPTRGLVRIFGRTLAKDYFGMKKKIGIVGENQHFYGEMTALEYLFFFADLYGVVNKKQVVTELLERVGLSQDVDQKLKHFSRGMQQKLSLIRALLHNPSLIILDEPVSSLDPNGIKQIRDLIREENERGKTIFISSHLLSEVEKTCHRIGIINNGVLVAEDTMDGVREKLTQEMELELELESIPKGIEESLRALPFINSVFYNNGVFRLKTGNKDRRGELSKYLTENGCIILSLRKHQLSLEEAFVTITENNISLLAGEVVNR